MNANQLGAILLIAAHFSMTILYTSEPKYRWISIVASGAVGFACVRLWML